MAIDWFDYFVKKMNEKGVRDLRVNETGQIPSKETPESIADQYDFERIVYEKEASKKIFKGHKHAVIWCDHYVCGDKEHPEKGVEVGFAIGLNINAEDEFSTMYDILGDEAYLLEGFDSMNKEDEEKEKAQALIDKVTDAFIALQKVQRYR